MTTFNLPDLGEGLAEAEIIRWHVKTGDRVLADQPMVAVETAKAVVEVPSPRSGIIKATHGQPGDRVATGAPLVEFESEADSGTVVGTMPAMDEDFASVLALEARQSGEPAGRAEIGDRLGSGAGDSNARAVPAARALAKRLGIDLTRVRGTGRAALITVDDVINSSAHSVNTGGRDNIPIPDTIPGHDETLRGPRRSMAQSMARSRDNVVACTVFDDADLSEWQGEQDITIRLLRAIAAGCTAEGSLNAWFDAHTETRRLLDRVDVAIAVDTSDGLIVPVVRNVGGLSLAELRREVDRLKRSAQARALTPEELRDFTFMLSNFGMIAGRYATPVVMPPAVAILGAGRIGQDVVAVKGQIEARRRVPLSLTFDHRCVTGGEAARFMAALIRDLQKGS